ncbi:MAG: undecaprenyl phosphate translocase family protein, partial [Verrucomicrobiota bacterium]
MSLKALGAVALKGIGIGVANIIPGVSGGTMAVVFGLYDRLIAALSGLMPGLRELMTERKIDRLRAEVSFLAAVGIGAVFGLVAFAFLIDWGLQWHPEATMLLFMGLILGSIPAVLRMRSLEPINGGLMATLAMGVLAVLLLGAPA